jgi:threonine synthase
MCPHTATCFKAYHFCRKDKSIKTIAYSTAEWTKFSPVIAKALTGEEIEHDQEALELIAKKANINIPSQISSLFDKEIVQKTVIDKQDIEKEILSFLNNE